MVKHIKILLGLLLERNGNNRDVVAQQIGNYIDDMADFEEIVPEGKIGTPIGKALEVLDGPLARALAMMILFSNEPAALVAFSLARR